MIAQQGQPKDCLSIDRYSCRQNDILSSRNSEKVIVNVFFEGKYVVKNTHKNIERLLDSLNRGYPRLQCLDYISE